jgi:hypothetical protein
VIRDRDSNGRFRKGNNGGPGRPRRAVEADYLSALSDAVPLGIWKKIVEKAVEGALAGDRHAREWVGNYLLGKPEQGKLLDLVAREMAGFDLVGSRACTFAITKPMVDGRIRLFLHKTGGDPPDPA